MTKKDIVKAISANVGMPQLAVKEIVQRTFDEIVEALIRDGKIELRNFGVFKVTKRAARPARNPRTNEKVHVPEKCVVTFKPGKEMQARVVELTAVPCRGTGDDSMDTNVAETASAELTTAPSTHSTPHSGEVDQRSTDAGPGITQTPPVFGRPPGSPN